MVINVPIQRFKIIYDRKRELTEKPFQRITSTIKWPKSYDQTTGTGKLDVFSVLCQDLSTVNSLIQTVNVFLFQRKFSAMTAVEKQTKGGRCWLVVADESS